MQEVLKKGGVLKLGIIKRYSEILVRFILVFFVFLLLPFAATKGADTYIKISSPVTSDANGEYVPVFPISASIDISAIAETPYGALKIVILADGVAKKSFDVSASLPTTYSCTYSLTGLAAGEHTIEARLYYSISGVTRQTKHIITIFVDDGSPVVVPDKEDGGSVTILSPALADTFGVNKHIVLTGDEVPITVQANAQSGVRKIEIYDNGNLVYTFDYGASSIVDNKKVTYNYIANTQGGHKIEVKMFPQKGEPVVDWTYVAAENSLFAYPVDYIGGKGVDGTFEDYTDTGGNTCPSGWSGNSAADRGGSIKAFTSEYSPYERGTTSVQISATAPANADAVPWMQASPITAIEAGGIYVYEVDLLRYSATDNAKTRTNIQGINREGNVAYDIVYMVNGEFNAVGLNGDTVFGTYTVGVGWNRLKLVVDADNGTMDVWLNGTKILPGFAMKDDPKLFAKIRISHAQTRGTSGSTCVDNVKLYRLGDGTPHVIDCLLVDGMGISSPLSLYAAVGTKQIKLTFDMDINIITLAEAVSLKDEYGTNIPFTAIYNEEDKAYVMTLLEPLSSNTKYIIKCSTAVENSTYNNMTSDWVSIFVTENSAFKVNGPRFYSNGKEVLYLSEISAGILHADWTVTQNKETLSEVMGILTIYKNNILIDVSLQRSIVTAGIDSSFSISLPYEFSGDIDGIEIKSMLWEYPSMEPIYAEQLRNDIGSAVMRSGFDGAVSIGVVNKHFYLQGADTSKEEPNDWSAIPYVRSDSDLFGPIRYAQINTENVNDYRLAAITSDPVNPNNNILELTHGSVVYGGKARNELNFHMNSGIKEIYYKQRVYFPENMNLLKDGTYQFKNNDWLSCAELWSGSQSWDVLGNLFPYRITIYLKEKYKPNSPIGFYAVGEKAAANNFVEIWRAESDFDVPIGKWMTWEIIYREGDANTGRFIFAVTPDGEQRRVLFNVNGWVYGPGRPNTDGMTYSVHALKLYTSSNIANWMDNHGQLTYYGDDLELYIKEE
jgi:hypothetical protein